MRLLLAGLLVYSAAVASSPDPAELEAAAIARQFVEELRPTLGAALKSGPPSEAIEICAEYAPALAHRLSSETGWTVRRVSLRPRNPGAAPDAWERARLRQFDEVVSAGFSLGPVSELIDGRLRYLVPQQTGAVCLLCHGESIDADTARALDKLYPADQARGYQPGEVRGAISLTSPATGS